MLGKSRSLSATKPGGAPGFEVNRYRKGTGNILRESSMKYQPPYIITAEIVNLVAEIGETLGRYTVLAEQNLTLILRNWRPLLAYLPVETVIRDRQEDYYRVLSVADQKADATPFIEFMLGALRDAVREAAATDQASDQVTDQVAALIRAIGTDELGSADLMQALGLSHRPTFRNNYLNPALEGEWIERTQPDSPRSPTQRYRLTGKGQRWLRHHADA